MTPAERLEALRKMADERRKEPKGKPITTEAELDAFIEDWEARRRALYERTNKKWPLLLEEKQK